ncbi:MAG: methyl-accepting chemotaxis protein [Rhodocyclaceae bacterium]|jgi:methyl-accepting chemotaxis protein|nr:methyl-accepting chemotaxis protein [Rhodocyclaceae bacterium]
MKSTTIRQRLFFLVIVPLLALAITAGNLIHKAHGNYRGATLTQEVLKVGVAAGELIHTLQIERGATAGFIQSKGGKFGDVLPGIRQNSDANFTAYQREAGSSGQLAALQAALGKAQEKLDQLKDVRNRADKLEISVADEVAAYTQTIARLIDVIGISGRFSSSPVVVQQSTAYLALVRAKEQAGQERALVTAAFAANAIEAPRFRMILERFHRQEAYLDIFRSAAGEAELKSLQDVLAGTPAQEVQRMRDVLVGKSASGGFDIDPTAWFTTITQKIDALHETENVVIRGISATTSDIVIASQGGLYGYIFLSLGAVVLVLLVSLKISASVAGPLQAEVEVAEFAVRESDFTRDVPETGPAEVIRAGHAFNQLMHTFRQIVADMKASSDRITAVAHELAGSSQEVRESSLAQADATAAVAAAFEQASVSVSETTANAENAARIVETARADTVAAMRVMGETVSNMRQIASLIRTSAGQVTSLSDSSQQIGGIVQVIQEIAEQTNLLALNAAIEAARAGEQGRGFAVVADEVRKLAERTAKATGEIGGLINAIQAGVENSVDSMEEANRQADASLKLVGETESALGRIDAGSQDVSSNVSAISYALKEQDAAIRQVAISIEAIAHKTERNNQAAESNNATARELDTLAGNLRTSVARFRA